MEGGGSDKVMTEGYVFHILTNRKFSRIEVDKLEKISKLLSQIYPCQIVSHVVDEEFFIKHNAPIWKGNYQTYFRFFVADFLGPEVKRALYLDVDMLVLDDIRKLWAIETDQAIMMVAKLPSVFQTNKFNAGFIFFNIKAWRNEGWKIKCLEYTKKNKALDQDTLNEVVDKDRIIFIPQAWDYCFQTYQSDGEDLLRFEKKEDFLKEVSIVHYIRPKPWGNIMEWFYKSRGRCLRYQGIIDLWWENALQTPVYSSELLDLKLRTNNEIERVVSSYIGGLVFFVIRLKRWFRNRILTSICDLFGWADNDRRR